MYPFTRSHQMKIFMRTVVLPQGQFSEFLHLKNKERRIMLQRIFHLEKIRNRTHQ